MQDGDTTYRSIATVRTYDDDHFNQNKNRKSKRSSVLPTFFCHRFFICRGSALFCATYVRSAHFILERNYLSSNNTKMTRLFVSLSALTVVSSFQAPIALPAGATKARTAPLFATLANKVDVSEQAPRNGQGFMEWAAHYGIQPENFQLTPIDGDNWGAVAERPARAGERALFVPSMLRMFTPNIKQQDFPNIGQVVAQKIDPKTSNGDIDLANHFYLFLKVLQEYDLGGDSPYYPWLDALPRKFNTAVNFRDVETDCLPPFVKFLSKRDQNNYSLFARTLKELNTPTISEATKSNMEITKWAFNVVFTRARESFGEAEIIPMSDMLNHASQPNVDIQWDNEGNVNVVYVRDVQAGEQLFKSYGHPTNPSRLLATYGFHDTSPPATYCKLFPGIEVPQDVKDMGFDYTTCVFYPENGGISEQVWDVMLYTMLGQMDPGQQQQFYQAHMTGDVQTKQQFHQHYMGHTATALVNHIDEMLGELSYCDGKLNSGEVFENMQMIANHNELVRQTFLKARNNLEQMMS